jgi:hypothetical protein
VLPNFKAVERLGNAQAAEVVSLCQQAGGQG